jgi:hypothetical protein
MGLKDLPTAAMLRSMRYREVYKCFVNLFFTFGGARGGAISRKVAGSIPDGVIGIFH